MRGEFVCVAGLARTEGWGCFQKKKLHTFSAYTNPRGVTRIFTRSTRNLTKPFQSSRRINQTVLILIPTTGLIPRPKSTETRFSGNRVLPPAPWLGANLIEESSGEVKSKLSLPGCFPLQQPKKKERFSLSFLGFSGDETTAAGGATLGRDGGGGVGSQRNERGCFGLGYQATPSPLVCI